MGVGDAGTGVGVGVASTNGAATTGIYLDDSALQTRNLLGIATGGGVFLPQLFDLERVEVLKVFALIPAMWPVPVLAGLASAWS